jgi:hypothetical protein
MIWTWFKDEWLITRQAAKLFFTSAILVLASVPVVLGWKIDIEKMSFWPRVPFAIYFVLLPIAIFFLWFGMWRYWVRIDHASRRDRRMWFVILLVGFWWGSCLYCLFVYLPQTFNRARDEV